MIDIRSPILALTEAANRTADLIESVGIMDLRLPKSEWDVGDAAAHLIYVLRGFTAAAMGASEQWEPIAAQLPATASLPERISAMNRLFIPAEPRRSPRQAARAVTEGAEGFARAVTSRSPDELMATPWYGETASLTLHQATCLLLGEQIFHGYDMAKAAHRRWPIAKADARLILEAVQAMFPRMARPDAMGAVSARIEVHAGGKGSFVAHCADGAITVEPPGQRRVDCHIATDPVAFVLLGYGRISLARAIAGANMFVWGRKPWLAFRFPGFVSHP